MSHPAGLPDLFIDRSLGRITVPRLLRAADLRLTTLAERYGVPDDEGVADVTWIADAGSRSEVVLMKDERIGRDRAERQAVIDHGVRCFCLARRDLLAEAMAKLFLDHLPAIGRSVQTTNEGAIWVVRQQGLRRMRL